MFYLKIIRDKLLVFNFWSILFYQFLFLSFFYPNKKVKNMNQNKIIIKLSSLKAHDQESIVSLLAKQDRLKGN
jgi:hypothetical protein